MALAQNCFSINYSSVKLIAEEISKAAKINAQYEKETGNIPQFRKL